jgi:hypothetical protein
MSLRIDVNGYYLTVVINPTTTNRNLYNSILSQLSQGSRGRLILEGKEIPYDNTPIDYYNVINKTGHFLLPVNINDVDDIYNQLSITISELNRIYLLWRQGQANKIQMKAALNEVKNVIDLLNNKIYLY